MGQVLTPRAGWGPLLDSNWVTVAGCYCTRAAAHALAVLSRSRQGGDGDGSLGFAQHHSRLQRALADGHVGGRRIGVLLLLVVAAGYAASL